MRYYVSVARDPSAKPLEVDVAELPDGSLDVRRDGVRVEVDVAFAGGACSVLSRGRVVDLVTEGAPPDLGVIASGHRSYIRVESERLRTAAGAKRGGGGAAERVLKSPMPGRIVKLLVAKGELVTAGQPLLVMEAMKMENEIKAKGDGTIAEIHVAAGAAVEAGARLVTLA